MWWFYSCRNIPTISTLTTLLQAFWDASITVKKKCKLSSEKPSQYNTIWEKEWSDDWVVFEFTFMVILFLYSPQNIYIISFPLVLPKERNKPNITFIIRNVTQVFIPMNLNNSPILEYSKKSYKPQKGSLCNFTIMSPNFGLRKPLWYSNVLMIRIYPEICVTRGSHYCTNIVECISQTNILWHIAIWRHLVY